VNVSLDGWDIGSFNAIDWVPWGSGGNARAKVLGSADGYYMALVEAAAGYRGDPHRHCHAEFLYVVAGSLHSQGREMVAGDGYAAAPGSEHHEFHTDSGATYLSIFRL
jgi:quercetin dioxygenase-like cupin family protein